jgi:phenylalanyl-tRNA synthetase alpha chain
MSEEQAILTYLSSNETIDDTSPWSTEQNLDHKKVVGTIKSLMVDGYVASTDLSLSYYTLTEQGTEVVQNGSQDYLVFIAVQQAGKLSLADLATKVGADVSKIGMANCMKNRWIKKDGGDLVPLFESVEDVVRGQLQRLGDANGNPDTIDDKVCAMCDMLCGAAAAAAAMCAYILTALNCTALHYTSYTMHLLTFFSFIRSPRS